MLTYGQLPSSVFVALLMVQCPELTIQEHDAIAKVMHTWEIAPMCHEVLDDINHARGQVLYR